VRRVTLRWTMVLALPLLLLVPAQAGLIENTTKGAVAYQFDGETHHDAPDECGAGSAAWSVPLDGSTDGMLVIGEDNADVFHLDIPASAVGSRVRVNVKEATGSSNLAFMVFAPSCDGSILDPHNLPVPFPKPPAPASNEKRLSVSNLQSGWDCFASEWVFQTDPLEHTQAPTSIHIAWTDGTEETVPLNTANPGQARYKTTSHLTTQIKDAWINVDSNFAGSFRIVKGPCNTSYGGAVYGDPPVLGNDVLWFTPIRAGAHEVRVTIYDVVPETPTSVPLSCHFCAGPIVEDTVKLVNYVLSTVKGN
jgi:hypothetical protein